MRSSGNVDRDFAATMMPHHQGAIAMMRAELRCGHNERLRRSRARGVPAAAGCRPCLLGGGVPAWRRRAPRFWVGLVCVLARLAACPAVGLLGCRRGFGGGLLLCRWCCALSVRACGRFFGARVVGGVVCRGPASCAFRGPLGRPRAALPVWAGPRARALPPAACACLGLGAAAPVRAPRRSGVAAPPCGCAVGRVPWLWGVLRRGVRADADGALGSRRAGKSLQQLYKAADVAVDRLIAANTSAAHAQAKAVDQLTDESISIAIAVSAGFNLTRDVASGPDPQPDHSPA